MFALRLRRPPHRSFSASSACASKIGRTHINLPPDVTLTETAVPARGRTAASSIISVKGPLGELQLPLPEFLRIEMNEERNKAVVNIRDAKERRQREMWGTTRAVIQNHVTGVSEGHVCVLRLVGVGYRATIEERPLVGKVVNLKVQYAHPVELPVPKGVKASTPQPTRILLEGSDKVRVKQFAAEIRSWRVPEPYKGKGIFVDGETIKLKNRKIK